MKTKKTFKQFVKENAKAIAAVTIGTTFCIGTYLWLAYVSRHTTDLDKPVIDGVDILQYYTQFGEKVMFATTDADNLHALIENLIQMFPEGADIFVEAVSKKK